MIVIILNQGGLITVRQVWCGGVTAAVILGAASFAAAQLPSGFHTPGATLRADAAKVCAADFQASAKPLSRWQRDEALTRYGQRPEDFTGELDHLIPQSLGGSNDPDNLWPQPAQGKFGPEAKHVLEAKLREMVCAEKTLTLKQAQDALKKDWVKAYDQYVQGQNAAK
jgi:hypothetical protein